MRIYAANERTDKGMREIPVQALRSGGFGVGAVSPLYDAFNMGEQFLA